MSNVLKVFNARFSRFILVGCVNTIVGFSLIFIFLNVFKASYFSSTIIGYSLGNIVSFLLNRNYTFKHQGNLIYSYFKFLIIFAGSYLLSYYTGVASIKFLAAYEFLLKPAFIRIEDLAIIPGAVVYLIVNYFGNSVFTFKQKKQSAIKENIIVKMTE